MKVKFSKFERIAGIFVLTAILGFMASLVMVAARQGWFESKISYSTKFASADGIHNGTVVQIAGLRAGSVDSVELLGDNQVLVTFTIFEKFQAKVTESSTTQLVRPFVIGERVLEITAGKDGESFLVAGTDIPSTETMDLMSLLGGKQIGGMLATFSSLLDNLKVLAEAFTDKNRTQSIIDVFDRIEPLVRNLNSMSVEVIKISKQITKDENLGRVMAELATTTEELNKLLPAMNEQAPHLATDMAQLVVNLSELTKEFKVVIPALAAVAPELPQTSRRAVEALDEAVVLMKAMQRSFFVKSHAQDVREDEAKKKNLRQPASDK